ncbi:MAG: glycoside hydrolase domain-containing protein, partial [Armatimonadota bacterium]
FLSSLDQAHYGSAWAEQYAVKNGDWHHYAGVWSRDKLAFYVDGKLLKDSPLPALPQELAGWFRLGDNGWLKPHTSHTLIDEVKLYRYALPAEQVSLAAQGQAVDYRPPLAIAVDPHPARGEWRVSVDAGGYTDDPQAQAVFTLSSGGTTSITSQPVAVKDGVATVNLDIGKVPAGDQTVSALITEASGKEAGRAEAVFNKPDKAPWANNTIGMQDRVLKPFTAMTLDGGRGSKVAAGGNMAGCWGRTYKLDGVFPSQIESQGSKLLTRPIALDAQTAAGPVTWRPTGSKITSHGDTRVKQEASADSPQFALATKTAVEYDGMLWTELTLTPKASTELTDLTLRVPIDARFARYLHHVKGYWGDDDAGLLPDAGFAGIGFHPYLWLGDDDRGLAWFADTQQGWSLAPGKPTVEAKREGDVVMLQVHLMNQPTKLDKPLRLSFGLQATPVKPRPADARSWRMGNLGTADDLAAPSMGTMQVLWPNGNLQFYGWPVPKDPVAFRKTVADLHAKGVRVLPYVNLNFMANGATEWEYYSSDFRDPARSFTTGDVAQMGSALIGACPSIPAWRDLIAWKLAKFVEEYQVDGIYVDCWNPNACLIEEHGCGWRDAQGNLQGRFSILGAREIVRRVQELLQDRVKNPHIIIHMSTTVCIPMLSFGDSMLDGEQYQAGGKDPKDDYQAIVPLDKWRAENSGLQWGVVPFFLPEFGGENRSKDYPTHRLMGLMLAHDCGPW